MNQSNIFSTTTTRTAFNTSRLFGISTSDNVLLKVTLGFLPMFVNLHKRIVYRAENEDSHNKFENEETIATTATNNNNNNNNRLILHFHSTDDNEEEGYTPELEEMSECSMGSGWSTGTDDSSLFMYQQRHEVVVIGKKNKTTTTTTETNSVSSIAVDDENLGRQVITGTRSAVSDISIASCSSDWDTVSMMTANQSIQDSGYLPSGSASVSSGGSTSSFVDSFYNFAFTPSVNSSRRRQRIKRRNGRGKNKQKNDDVCSFALKEECGVIVEAEPSEDIDIESTMSI
jgi:hypothetical protein